MLIRWTLPATGDLTQICDYVEQHGSAAASRRIALSILRWSYYPEEVSCTRAHWPKPRHPLTCSHGFAISPSFTEFATKSSKFFGSCTAPSSGRKRRVPRPSSAWAGVFTDKISPPAPPLPPAHTSHQSPAGSALPPLGAAASYWRSKSHSPRRIPQPPEALSSISRTAPSSR